MIELVKVNKSFQNMKVLSDIDFTIHDNEVFGLVGPSGVGKSTLLNCLIGLEDYQSGSIAIDGVRLEGLNELEMRKFRKNMGMIFQNFSLIGRKDVFHNRNLLGGLYRENPVKSRNYEAVKSSKKWKNVGNSYIIPALLLYRHSYI